MAARKSPGRPLRPIRLAFVLLAAAMAVVVVISAQASLVLSVGNREGAAASPAGVQLAASDPVIAAAGDIACDPSSSNFNGGLGSSSSCRMKYTSDLLVNTGVAGVLLLGDNQYYCGGYSAFVQSYDLSWGRVKSITYPAVGNHEYLTSGGTDCNSGNAGAAGYYRYFGAAAGDPAKGYYSYDIGSWHLIALNSQCSTAGGCGATSAQGSWLRADLAAHPNYCTLAYWHIPLFSSGGRANANTQSFWDALYAADADVVLTGHDHTYERFAPQAPNGSADAARGIRQWVVGTGGANHTSFAKAAANSELYNDKTFGVLRLTLHATSYDWQFVPEAGATFGDTGRTDCHGNQNDTTPPTAPTNLTATATSPAAVALAWTASSDDIGVSGYRVYRDGSELAPVTTTSYTDTGVLPGTTHTYTVVAVDGGGNVSPHSSPATATTPADTQRPSAPGALNASAASATQVNLTWTASSDNSGIADYQVFRGGSQVGTSTTTSYTDTTVQAQTSYSYTVVARDLANNLSNPSNAASVTTPAAPTTLTFTAAADAYVESGQQAAANFGGATQIITDASPARRFLLKFAVSGVNGRQITSAKLRLNCVNSSSVGGAFHRVADSSWGENTVTWNNQPPADTATIASLGPVSALSTYEVDVGTLVTGDGTYTIEVDSASNDGAYYSSKEGSVPPQLVLTMAGGGASDTTRPTAPTNLTATAPNGNRAELSWTASTDDVGVVDYQVLRAGVPVGTSTTPSYADTTVQPGQTYSYTVVARDGAGNVSDPSNTATVTTPASATLTFAPSADTYVQSDQPAVNFGSSTQFVADSSPIRRVLLKFVVSGVSGRQVVSAKLRLRCVDASGNGGNFHRVADSSWSEASVNWNNQPAADATVIASLAAVSAGTTYEVDLASLVTTDGTYTVEVDSTSTNGAYYSSKEGSVAPQLVLTLS